MRALAVTLLGVLLFPGHAHGADGAAPQAASGAPTAAGPAASTQSGVNLVAFIGRKIEARYVEPKKGEVPFNAEYFLRYEVLQVVFGTYPKKEIAFSSYVHSGQPEFKRRDFGLVYVSENEGRWVQQTYLFQTVYPTADGRWAGCGDPYAGMPDMHRHGVKPEPIAFKPPVVFDIRGMPARVVERRFPPALFRRDKNAAVCKAGNYPQDLFR